MSREDLEYSEKRDFIRMFINAPISYSASGSGEWQKGIGKDLSATGIAFVTHESYNDGDLIEIKLKPETTVTPPLEATVKVVRCSASEDGGYELSTIIEKIQ